MKLDFIFSPKEKKDQNVRAKRKKKAKKCQSTEAQLLKDHYQETNFGNKLSQAGFLGDFSKLGSPQKNKKSYLLFLFQEKIKVVIYLLNCFILLNLIYPILSFYNISIKTIEINESVYYPILNTLLIGKPIHIYINDSLLFEDNDYYYNESYLFIQSNFSGNIQVLLVWDETIGEIEKEVIITTDILTTEPNTEYTTSVVFSDTDSISIFKEPTTNNDYISTIKETDTYSQYIRQIKTNDYPTETEEIFSHDNFEPQSESSNNNEMNSNTISETTSITTHQGLFLQTDEMILSTEISTESTSLVTESTFLPVTTEITTFIIPKKINLNAKEMFRNCYIIQTIDFSEFDLERVFNMERMFDSCTSLKEVYHFFPQNVQDMSYLFSNCISLTCVEFNNTDNLYYSKATNMEYMFNNCFSLKVINLTFFETHNVTKMN